MPPESRSKTTNQWHAIVTRDTASKVFYGVRTTGIYCRASCPARLARRANVVFYDTPAQAEADGFRACKRCSPNQDSTKESPSQLHVVKAGCDSIAEAVRAGRTVRLAELAAAAGLTPCYYHRVFKRVRGLTPGQYARVCKSGGGGSDETGRGLDCGDGFMDEFVDWEGERLV